MFPINFNFPYRKKDGSIITMQKALDGAGADLDLIDLDDVAITTPSTGDALLYNGTSKKWENKPIELDTDDLGDVDITTPTDGDVLVYNGTTEKWENRTTREVLMLKTTPEIIPVSADPILTGLTKYKYIVITYVYGLTGWQYTKLIPVPTFNSHILNIFDNTNIYTSVSISASGDLLVTYNGTSGGVYIKEIDGIL